MRQNWFVDPAEQDWRRNFRPDIPSGARVYDFLLGGKDNYPADREVARTLLAKLPNARLAVQWNRALLRRVVRYLVSEVGIDQIIDIGAGLPSVGNTHDVALEANPAAHVVYVDHDPVVLAHARDMLHGIPNTAIIERDLLEPEAILADPDVMSLINFSRPVALMFLSMLHFVPDEADPAGIIARLHAPFPAGTHVALSHVTAPVLGEIKADFEKATEQLHPRDRSAVLGLVSGLEVVPPGLVWLPQWRPDPDAVMPENPAEAYYYALVARKR